MKTLKEVEQELLLLDDHMKTYHVGYYPMFYFTKFYGVNANDMLGFLLLDFYETYDFDVGVKVKEWVQIGKRKIYFSESDRLMLSWYLLQRIAIQSRSVTDNDLKKPMCQNRNGNPVKAPAYRRVLERASKELGLSRCYNTSYLKSVYAYREIALGHKTINEVAELFNCSKMHLKNCILKPFLPVYDGEMIQKIAGTRQEEDVKFI